MRQAIAAALSQLKLKAGKVCVLPLLFFGVPHPAKASLSFNAALLGATLENEPDTIEPGLVFRTIKNGLVGKKVLGIDIKLMCHTSGDSFRARDDFGLRAPLGRWSQRPNDRTAHGEFAGLCAPPIKAGDICTDTFTPVLSDNDMRRERLDSDFRSVFGIEFVARQFEGVGCKLGLYGGGGSQPSRIASNSESGQSGYNRGNYSCVVRGPIPNTRNAIQHDNPLIGFGVIISIIGAGLWLIWKSLREIDEIWNS